MSIIANFSENGDFLGLIPKKLDADNVNSYLSQYGKHRALGYFDCLDDMIELLGDVVSNSPNSTDTQLREKITNFINQQNDVWQKFETILGDDVHKMPLISIPVPKI